MGSGQPLSRARSPAPSDDDGRGARHGHHRRRRPGPHRRRAGPTNSTARPRRCWTTAATWPWSRPTGTTASAPTTSTSRPTASAGDTQGALYTERPIYRPGQTVYFKGHRCAPTTTGATACPADKQIAHRHQRPQRQRRSTARRWRSARSARSAAQYTLAERRAVGRLRDQHRPARTDLSPAPSSRCRSIASRNIWWT